MKLCYCRFLMAAVIIVLAIVWLDTSWAKWVIVASAGVLAIMSLFFKSCFCTDKKKPAEE